MDSRGGTAVLRVANGERKTWQRCNLAAGQLAPAGLPVSPDGVRGLWLCEGGVLRWLVGSVPTRNDGRHVLPQAYTTNPSTLAEPGRPFEVWEWRDGSDAAPKRLFHAETEWLAYQTPYGDPRIRACRIKPGGRGRIEYIQVDASAGAPVASLISEGVYDQHDWQDVTWHVAGLSQADSPLCVPPFVRVSVANRVTGERKRLRSLPGPFALSRTFWSPTGESFLHTRLAPKLRLRWRRDPENPLAFVEQVYLVDLASH